MFYLLINLQITDLLEHELVSLDLYLNAWEEETQNQTGFWHHDLCVLTFFCDNHSNKLPQDTSDNQPLIEQAYFGSQFKMLGSMTD